MSEPVLFLVKSFEKEKKSLLKRIWRKEFPEN